MSKKLLIVSIALLTLPLQGAFAATTPTDSLIKGSLSTIYYYGSDGYRYVFPNSGTFFSWFKDFSSVKTITDQELGTIPLKANITYRPGVRLVKIQTDPKVYAIDKGGVLRWIETEDLAAKLYGADWNKNIDDVADSFFVNYTLGTPIDSETNYKPDSVAASVKSINKDKGLEEKDSTPKSDTEVGKRSSAEMGMNNGNALGHSATSTEETGNPHESATSTPSGTTPATPATPSPGTGTAATPATPATPGNGQGQPIITNIQVVPAISSATATWDTNMPADSLVEYGTTASYGYSVHSATDSVETTIHSVEIYGLAAATTYHYRVCSQHNNQNSCSDDDIFTTLIPPQPPQQPPIVVTYPRAGDVLGYLTIRIAFTAHDITKFGFELLRGTQVIYESQNGFSLDTPLSYSFPPQYNPSALVEPLNVDSTNDYDIQFPIHPAFVTVESGSGYKIRIFNWDNPDVYGESGDYSYDVTPPTVSSVVASQITTNSVTITWSTDEPATGFVNYGSTASNWKSTPEDYSFATLHSFTLSNLTANTPYTYRVYSNDALGNSAVLSTGYPPEHTFTTSATSTQP